MRGIQTHNYLYLFNPWSNGQRNMATATNETATWKRMLALATQDPTINARVQVMRHRTVEELYDIQKDPGCLVNLINSKEHTEKIKELQKSLHEWMDSTKDHAITAFSARTNPKKMEFYIKTVQTKSDFRRKNKRGKKRGKKA
jgi:N-sulfoglucosamine sulfohydrolase